ncbi:MAG TPA: YraN family protein [Pirellulales bacterium]|jgi:putative endonuclease|nr:YraN family protein [Pirellulales bacterium]
MATRTRKPRRSRLTKLSVWVTGWARQFRARYNSSINSLRRALAPKTLGQRGEAVAARYLKRLGYVIVARGSHIRRGEIDLIAVDGRTVVFVEVKTRVSHDAGHPAEAVDRDKQHRLTRLAMIYLKRHGLLETSARFDVIAITWPKGQRRPTIEHFKNAFEPVGEGQMFY